MTSDLTEAGAGAVVAMAVVMATTGVASTSRSRSASARRHACANDMTNASAHLAEIYTLLCRSGLNKEYYGNVLHRTQRFNDLLEILIAVGTTGSGISAFTIWQLEPYGPWVWGTLTAASALLAVAKPIIQLNKRIERLTRLYVGHADNYASLHIIVSRIRRLNDVTPELRSSCLKQPKPAFWNWPRRMRSSPEHETAAALRGNDKTASSAGRRVVAGRAVRRSRRRIDRDRFTAEIVRLYIGRVQAAILNAASCWRDDRSGRRQDGGRTRDRTLDLSRVKGTLSR